MVIVYKLNTVIGVFILIVNWIEMVSSDPNPDLWVVVHEVDGDDDSPDFVDIMDLFKHKTKNKTNEAVEDDRVIEENDVLDEIKKIINTQSKNTKIESGDDLFEVSKEDDYKVQIQKNTTDKNDNGIIDKHILEKDKTNITNFGILYKEKNLKEDINKEKNLKEDINKANSNHSEYDDYLSGSNEFEDNINKEYVQHKETKYYENTGYNFSNGTKEKIHKFSSMHPYMSNYVDKIKERKNKKTFVTGDDYLLDLLAEELYDQNEEREIIKKQDNKPVILIQPSTTIKVYSTKFTKSSTTFLPLKTFASKENKSGTKYSSEEIEKKTNTVSKNIKGTSQKKIKNISKEKNSNKKTPKIFSSKSDLPNKYGIGNSSKISKSHKIINKNGQTQSNQDNKKQYGDYEINNGYVKKHRKNVNKNWLLRKNNITRSKYTSNQFTVCNDSKQFSKEALKRHNQLRKAEGKHKLIQSVKLCNSARKWAKHIAKIDKIEYEEGITSGENIAVASGCIDPISIVDMWDGEKESGDNNRMHYAQVVWKATEKFCMVTEMSENGSWYTVARYLPSKAKDLGKYNQNICQPKPCPFDTKDWKRLTLEV